MFIEWQIVCGGEVGGDGNAVEVTTTEVSIVELPSPMVTFVSLSDKFTCMFGISTSSKMDSVCETPGGVTFVLLAIEVLCCSLGLIF